MNGSDESVSLGSRLKDALHLSTPPIGIAFVDVIPEGVELFSAPIAEPAPDGRTGRVAAGCVFWMRAVSGSFATQPADHRNCSVGSFTHGLVSLSDVAGNSDVGELLDAGWVSEEQVTRIPSVSRLHSYICYGPLEDGLFTPEVVLLRLNPRQMMVISDAIDVSIEGKPQCHIIAVAKEENRIAASVGCALSRARTGMQPEEMTCAIPSAILSAVVEAVERAADIDAGVAKYAARDARRFASQS